MRRAGCKPGALSRQRPLLANLNVFNAQRRSIRRAPTLLPTHVLATVHSSANYSEDEAELILIVPLTQLSVVFGYRHQI